MTTHCHLCHGRSGHKFDCPRATTTARSEAACWLNEDCTRGYHGVMDEDGCQYGALGALEGGQDAHNRPLTAQQVENEPVVIYESERP